jgi:hypothetical protein
LANVPFSKLTGKRFSWIALYALALGPHDCELQWARYSVVVQAGTCGIDVSRCDDGDVLVNLFFAVSKTHCDVLIKSFLPSPSRSHRREFFCDRIDLVLEEGPSDSFHPDFTHFSVSAVTGDGKHAGAYFIGLDWFVFCEHLVLRVSTGKEQ